MTGDRGPKNKDLCSGEGRREEGGGVKERADDGAVWQRGNPVGNATARREKGSSHGHAVAT